MSLSVVEAVAANLKSATNFSDIFGSPPAGDLKTRRAFVRRQFAYLAQLVHPDHIPDGKDLAEDAFEHLRALFNAADKALEGGIYDQPFRAGHRHDTRAIEDFFELRSRTATYRCSNNPYRTGDFSVLYRGQQGDVDVLVKIAREPTSNGLLELESRRLQAFEDKLNLSGIRGFLPKLLDTFMVPGPGRRQFRANVMGFKPSMLSLTDIREACHGKLDPKHAAWIARRVMAQTCAAAMAGLVHGAITPDHVLVDPVKHEPLHIGWLHGVDKTGRITMVVDRWKSFYPPEVFRKEKPDHRTDIYMAGKTCIWLFGGDGDKLPDVVPEKVRRILLACIISEPKRRPDNGLILIDELTSAIRDTWGRVYKPLLLPI